MFLLKFLRQVLQTNSKFALQFQHLIYCADVLYKVNMDFHLEGIHKMICDLLSFFREVILVYMPC
jgi:hypothetical protein